MDIRKVILKTKRGEMVRRNLEFWSGQQLVAVLQNKWCAHCVSTKKKQK